MSLIKKIDVPAYLAARQARRRTGALFMSQPAANGISKVKSTGTKVDAQGFVEDFSLEHSSLRVIAIPAPMAADTAAKHVIAVPITRKA